MERKKWEATTIKGDEKIDIDLTHTGVFTSTQELISELETLLEGNFTKGTECSIKLRLVTKKKDKNDKQRLDDILAEIASMEITPFGYILDFLIDQGLNFAQIKKWFCDREGQHE